MKPRILAGVALLSLALTSLAQTTATPETTSETMPKTTAEKKIEPAKVAPAMDEAAFAQCRAELITEAEAQHISRGTIDQALAKVQLSHRVIELDRQQPEFSTTFADYLNRRVTTARVEEGRKLLAQHRALLNRVSSQYGVPVQYLVAFWGLETNYGSYFGKMSVLDSLATLACDPRRSEYFTGELMDALRIIDEGAIKPERMEGSWAGAMGHVQFMPSAFLRHAVDYDGDNKRDLWNSIPDAMGSAAHFLQNLGWEKGSRWGREVKLPEGFTYLEAGLNNHRPLAEWHKLGVRQANGSALPTADLKAALLVPAGHQGPAFLVYDNFNVIMRWNRSEYYALAVGHLADRIIGAGELIQAPPTDAPRLHRDHVINLQEKLQQAGIESVEADGIFGPATRRALGEFQQKHGLIADGFPSATVLQLLGVEVRLQ
jgi:membrane-bound lytic murein transglycosylase B